MERTEHAEHQGWMGTYTTDVHGTRQSIMLPALSDLRGSGGLEQLSDAVIAFSRNQTSKENQDKIESHILKNRWKRKTGEADDLLYIMDTGRVVLFDEEQAAFNNETDDTPF